MNAANRLGSNVLAVIVSFNGGREILECIDAILLQAGRVLVVDNGSLPGSLDLLKDLQREGKIQLISSRSNLGLAAALNLGVKEGLTSGFKWILTLDQDSGPSRDMLEVMLNYFAAHDDALVLSPNFVSRDGEKKTDKSGEVKYAITSGNLIHKSVFENVGLFNAGYFIDCLDFDFSLRVRKNGFKIHKVGGATMTHEVGVNMVLPKIVGGFYTQHEPSRRYYMFRNFILLTKSHFRFDPKFILKLGVLYCVFLLLLIVYDKRRFFNLQLIFKGVKDGVIGRSGPLSVS